MPRTVSRASRPARAAALRNRCRPSAARWAGRSASSPPSSGVYVVGKDSKNIARISSDGTWKFFPTGGDPFDIAKGLDGDVYFTDRTSTRVRRLISSAPRITGGAGAATAHHERQRLRVDRRARQPHHGDVRVRTDDRVRRGGHRPGQRRGSVPGRRHAHRARAGHDVPPAGAGDQRGGRGRPERRHDLRDARRTRADADAQGAGELQLGLHRLPHRAHPHPGHRPDRRRDDQDHAARASARAAR